MTKPEFLSLMLCALRIQCVWSFLFGLCLLVCSSLLAPFALCACRNSPPCQIAWSWLTIVMIRPLPRGALSVFFFALGWLINIWWGMNKQASKHS